MPKKIQPLKDAPELPPEVAGPIEPEEVIKLDDKVEGPIDDKLADLMEEAVHEEPEVSDLEAAPVSEEAEESAEASSGPQTAQEAENSDETVAEEPESVEDEFIDKAVEDIEANESGQDDPAEEIDEKTPQEHTKLPKQESKFKHFIMSFWRNRRLRWGVTSGFVFAVLVLSLIPNSRYFILNTSGVRATMSLKVIDSGTLQPLKNARVSAGGASSLTDSEGVAKLEKVRLGRTDLKIEKRAFSTQSRPVTIGWGSNPLGDFQATAIGTQYVFEVKDAFSGQPLSDAEAVSGDGNAHADQDGKLVLTLDTAELDDAAQLSVDIENEGYRTETINITVNNKEVQQVNMVPMRKHVFISKRSGNYDVYTVDIDGKNESRIVGGTGLERDDIALIPHPVNNRAALVSTRENTRNQYGYLLSTLYIVNTEDGDIMKIDQSEQIKVVGWSGDRLVYVKVAAGASGSDPKRHRLMSFDDASDSTKELDSSNAFNDVVMADNRVYYAPSNIFQESSPAVYAVNADGGQKQTILDKEVYTIVRSGYDALHLNAGDDWYLYKLSSAVPEKTQQPSSQIGRVYADSPGGKYSLWVDSRDGKGVLLSYDKSSKEEKILIERGGLKLPVYWLNQKYIVFRVSDGKETADYAINLDGGEAKKITDSTDTSGITRWLYY